MATETKTREKVVEEEVEIVRCDYCTMTNEELDVSESQFKTLHENPTVELNEERSGAMGTGTNLMVQPGDSKSVHSHESNRVTATLRTGKSVDLCPNCWGSLFTDEAMSAMRDLAE